MAKSKRRVVRRKRDPQLVPGPVVITLARFRELEAVLRANRFSDLIAWSEALAPPRDCRTFAREAIYVICNSGMKLVIANAMYWRVLRTLNRGESAALACGHTRKARAIDYIWQNRRRLFDGYRRDPDKLYFCRSLPFIGPVTQYHLAKNLGENTVKPDVHLDRLAYAEGLTAWEMCHRLAQQTGYREATIDTILFAASTHGLLDSYAMLTEGWEGAFTGKVDPWRGRPLRHGGSTTAPSAVLAKPRQTGEGGI